MSGAIPLLPLHVFMPLVTNALGLTIFVYVIIIRGAVADMVDQAIQRRVVGCLVNNYSH